MRLELPGNDVTGRFRQAFLQQKPISVLNHSYLIKRLELFEVEGELMVGLDLVRCWTSKTKPPVTISLAYEGLEYNG